MFLTGLTDTLQTVKHLFTTVASQVEPGILLDGNGNRNTAQTEQFLTTALLQHLLLIVSRVHCFTQALQIFVDKSVGHLHVSIFAESNVAGQSFLHMLAKQGQDFVLVLRCHHPFEDIILLFSLFFLAVLDVAANQKYHCYHDKDKHTHEAGIEHDEGNQCTDCKCYEGCDKPSADY